MPYSGTLCLPRAVQGGTRSAWAPESRLCTDVVPASMLLGKLDMQCWCSRHHETLRACIALDGEASSYVPGRADCAAMGPPGSPLLPHCMLLLAHASLGLRSMLNACSKQEQLVSAGQGACHT